MLKIWGRASSANVQKVLWTCVELGLAYERRDVGGPYGGNREPGYLALNPNGLVPTIDDAGFVLWESNAILRYLAATRGASRLLPAGPRGRAEVERWMDWQLSVVAGPHTVLYVGLVRTPEAERDTSRIERARRQQAAAFAILDQRLQARSHVAGEDLTVADIALGPFVYRWFTLPIERPELPRLAAWYERLAERPGYRRHVMVELT
jgi:glutathione S-transferase